MLYLRHDLDFFEEIASAILRWKLSFWFFRKMYVAQEGGLIEHYAYILQHRFFVDVWLSLDRLIVPQRGLAVRYILFVVIEINLLVVSVNECRAKTWGLILFKGRVHFPWTGIRPLNAIFLNWRWECFKMKTMEARKAVICDRTCSSKYSQEDVSHLAPGKARTRMEYLGAGCEQWDEICDVRSQIRTSYLAFHADNLLEGCHDFN